MININELRIGNYVFDNLKTWIIKIHSANGIANVESKPEEYNPIEITEEILLMAGAKDNNYTLDFYAGKKKISFDWYYRVVATGKRSGFSSRKYKHIKYFHQLQNLYFALTGEELTINESNA